MTDLFDLANLITAVGVDGVKIKSEPGLPKKSSNEILTELFSTFDTDKDTLSPENSSQQITDANAKVTTESDKSPTKKRKNKKKHKHKLKKHKKKSKHNLSDNNSDTEDGIKKKKKYKKKSKRRHNSVSSNSSDSDEAKSKKIKLADEFPETTKHNDKISEIKSDGKIQDEKANQEEPNEIGKIIDNSDSPRLPPIAKRTDDETDEPIVPKLLEKSKHPVQGKILIKDLKNSIVYNETVKAIENQEKAKAAKMEDGELSDSSTDNRTPTLSPTPSRGNSFRSLSVSPGRSRIKSRTLSPMKEADLRFVLREKEKKRLNVIEKNKIYTNDNHKNDLNYKAVKDEDSKRSQSYHSPDRKRSTSRTRHSSHHRSRSGGRERRRNRSREKADRDRSNDRRDSGRSRERRRYKSRSNDRNKNKGRGRSRSRERKERIEIDKKKLLEIARKNAINMIKQGTLPLAQQDKAIAAIQAGGKTVDELTDFCKSLSKSEALGELSSISSEDEESESEKGFHHPFLLKERPSSIIMNIRDAKQLPTKTFQEKTAETSNQLRLQFPVSSGQHHRKTENEWVPVMPKKPEAKKLFVPAAASNEPLAATSASSQTSIQPAQTTVFPQTVETMDIGSIVSQRLAAMRKLRENPNDVSALNAMHRAQNEMKTWAESKQMPGQFTGSTGVKVLTSAELSSGYQAWARKDQLVSAQPVSGGMGMALLQKMGWRPGEGLGKNKEGTLEPLQLEVKLDKRGLVSEQDIGQKGSKMTKPVIPAIKTLEGKHPVSLLGEYCSKRKLGAPVYELCFECGPDHRKNFLFKVKVNGIEYKPSVASPNKKQAKAEAAQICLQTLGLLPS